MPTSRHDRDAAHAEGLAKNASRRLESQPEYLARLKWNRTYSQPFLRDFHNQVPSYFVKDDHDSWQNDCWPSQANNLFGQNTLPMWKFWQTVRL